VPFPIRTKQFPSISAVIIVEVCSGVKIVQIMADSVKIVECPRDAWQGLQGHIPTDLKVDYLKALISAGFKHIDAVSFVSPKAVPQMADSEAVLKELDPPDDVEIIGIVVNEKGAQRAISTQAVRTTGFPYSISPTFLRNNQRQTPEESLEELENIQKAADDAGIDVVVYISMAFGNPYGDDWSADEVVAAVDLLESNGIKTISLADTVGLASPEQIRELVSAVMDKYSYLEIGVHLHSRPDLAAEKVQAAYDAGCRRFDSAIGGLGGCPFAQDALVGNIPTEAAVEALKQRNAQVPALKSLDTLLRASTEIGARYTASHAAD
jgi:hydroxymethylglutaryl-CoA lyase